MDHLVNLLKMLGYNDDELAPFQGSFLLSPSYDTEKHCLHMPLSCPQPLSCQVYNLLNERLKTYLGCEAKITINATDPHTGTNELRGYIREFESLGRKDFSYILPQDIDNTNVLIIPNNRDPRHPDLNWLKDQLRVCGISARVMTVAQSRPAEPQPEQGEEHKTFKPMHIRIPEGAENVPLNDITSPVDHISITGEIFSLEVITTKKNKILLCIGLHEGNDAFLVKAFEGRRFDAERLNGLKVGQRIRVFGNVQTDEQSGLAMLADAIEDAEPLPGRKDTAPRKRIELHAHTNKSEMDGICECKDLVKTAFKWGMPAIGLCDRNVVQEYPDAQASLLGGIDKAPGGAEFKVIFGLEMSTVDDRAKIITNGSDDLLGPAEYCVFDLETSGLSNQYDDIIEFGAVKFKNGYQTDRLQMFIKPRDKILPFTTELTGITQADLDPAPTLAEAWPRIKAFMEGTVLVAHNGYFDYGFLDAASRRLGEGPLTLPMIDTLPLARVLLPARSAYRLGNLARNFHLEYDEEDAHRADYDAEVLGGVFTQLLHMVGDYEKMTVRELDDIQEKWVYKKNHPYTISLLAKDQQGIKDIYDIVTIAHTEYLTGGAGDNGVKKSAAVPEPRIVKSEIACRRDHVLLGTGTQSSELFEIACNRSQEEIERCMSFYDYVEIEPPENCLMQLDETSTFNYERVKVVLKNIIDTAKKLGKPVVAVGDSRYIDPEDKTIWDIFLYAKRIGGSRHPMYYSRKNKPDCAPHHFRTTEEMLAAFSFLDEATREEVVIDNTWKIAEQIEKLHPIFTDVHTPNIDGCDKILHEIVYNTAHEQYGDPLPDLVKERLDFEFDNVVGNGYAVQYYIAHLLVKQSRENGYVVGSRGSVGSSFLATMAKITEVNPLVPHYRCPKCKHSEFFTNNEFVNGFDMPEKDCPVCGTKMIHDGHNIPFQTFLGFNGDKVPDIDLNFSGEYQNKAQLQIKDVFGAENVFAAGTIATVEFKTALGYVRNYQEELELPPFNSSKMNYLATKCVGVKRTTGQHPAGIVVCPKINHIHDFTPLQYPANNADSPWKTTHFAIKDLHDTILKLDILGHVDPTAMRMLHDISGIDPLTVPCNDPETLSLFNRPDALKILDLETKPYPEETGAIGIPEFGTQNSRGVLIETRPSSFAELVSLEGLTHGTDVWRNNAQDLIREGTCTLKTVIGCRDDIMTYLISKGLPKKEAFDIMEFVRKGKGLKPEWVPDMLANNVPEWYIESCRKIKYMFPKAHAVAYCMMALRIAWFKVHHPEYFYAVYFSIRADAYEIETLIKGEQAVYNRMQEIAQHKREMGKKLPAKESSLYDVMEVAYEMYRRGYRFTNLSLELSEASRFRVDPNDNHAIIPPFTTIDGLGTSVGNSVVKARNEHPFISRQDLADRTSLSASQLEVLNRMGVLDGLQDTNQLSLF